MKKQFKINLILKSKIWRARLYHKTKKLKITLKTYNPLKCNCKNLKIKLHHFKLKLKFTLVSRITMRHPTIKTESKTLKTKLINLRLLINLLIPIWKTKTINGTNSGVNMSNRWRILLTKPMLTEISNVSEKLWNK